MDIPSAALVRNQGEKASGPYEVYLNGEPFDVERSFIHITDFIKEVSFRSPVVELYQRQVGFQLPLAAQPGTYPINSENIHNVGFLVQTKYVAKPGPEDPPGFVQFQNAFKGSIELTEWDPQTGNIVGSFEFQIYYDESDQYQTFRATFNLRPIK